MKKLAIAVLCGMPCAVSAADLAPIPRVAPFTWSGFYVGANGGWGTASASATTSAPALGFVATSSLSNISGGLAGGQAGYNWQAGALVAGIEGDYQWADLHRALNFGCGAACAVQEKVTLTSFGTVRGRVGAAFEQVLLYATAGGAWLTASDEASLTLRAAATQLGKVSLSGAGWVAGAGAEAAIDRNWSVKAEYLYLSTSNLRGSGAVTGLGPVQLDTTAHAHIARLGVNYRF